MLFSRCVSGTRAVPQGKRLEIEGHVFEGYGAHHSRRARLPCRLAPRGMTRIACSAFRGRTSPRRRRLARRARILTFFARGCASASRMRPSGASCDGGALRGTAAGVSLFVARGHRMCARTLPSPCPPMRYALCASPCAPARRARLCGRAQPAARQPAARQPGRRAASGGAVALASSEEDAAAELPAERASQDAYNRAMQAYSQSPFSYQHEAGLCACRRGASRAIWPQRERTLSACTATRAPRRAPRRAHAARGRACRRLPPGGRQPARGCARRKQSVVRQSCATLSRRDALTLASPAARTQARSRRRLRT
jgi:hypothetical protein